MHRDEIAARLKAILGRALPRERVILKELPEGVERQDVMVLTKEDYINLEVFVASLLERADALANVLARFTDARGILVVPDGSIGAAKAALAAYRGRDDRTA